MLYAAVDPTLVKTPNAPTRTMAQQHEDILLEIPELDGITLRPGTAFAITRLDTPCPVLTLGSGARALTYHGTYCTSIGTTVLLQRASQASVAAGGEIVQLLTTTTKRLLFERAKGTQSDLQALTDATLKVRSTRPKCVRSKPQPRGKSAAAKSGQPKKTRQRRGAGAAPAAKRGRRSKAAEEEEEEEEEEEGEEEEGGGLEATAAPTIARAGSRKRARGVVEEEEEESE